MRKKPNTLTFTRYARKRHSASAPMTPDAKKRFF